jgi:hypothetical protein
MKHTRSVSADGVPGALFRRTGQLAVIALMAGLACAAEAQETVTINFDGSGMAPGVHAGNIYLDRGVRITSCQSPNNIKVGGTITLTGQEPWFEIWQWGWAVSPPNYLLPLNVGVTDVLLTFTVPVTSVELDLDLYGFETVPNNIRLVALEPAGGNSYTVLKYSEAADGKAAAPATHLAVNDGGTAFSAALFQVLTELEGFDNLKFATTGPIPTPPEEGPPGPAPPGSGGWAGGGGGGPDVVPPTTNVNSAVDTNANENKTPESPSNTNESSLNDNSGVDNVPDSGGTGAVNLNSDTGGTPQNGGSGGGACGAPVAIIMLCGMLLLRLLHQGGRARGKL